METEKWLKSKDKVYLFSPCAFRPAKVTPPSGGARKQASVGNDE